MAREQGYYSLVQFCPDPARAEVANLGVLLFSPAHDFIEVALSKSTRRVKTIFPRLELDPTQIKSMQRWLKDRLEVERDRFRTKDDLTHFIETRFNDVRLTAPRSIAVERPAEQLKSLFAELVAMPRKEESVEAPAIGEARSPFRRLDAFFHRPQISQFVEFDRQVELPVSGQKIDIPYVFTNGSVSLVKPEEIGTFDVAKRRLAEGLLLAHHRTADNKRQEFLVMAGVEKPKLRDQIGQLSAEVSELGVHFFVEEQPLMAFLEAKATAH